VTRTRVATIPLDDDTDLVVSLDAQGDLDLRRWTQTGDLKFPSKHGATVPRGSVRDLIEALREALDPDPCPLPDVHQPRRRGRVMTRDLKQRARSWH
jgi:hypothetical protein